MVLRVPLFACRFVVLESVTVAFFVEIGDAVAAILDFAGGIIDFAVGSAGDVARGVFGIPGRACRLVILEK